MRAGAKQVALQAKGFLLEQEGDKLFELASEISPHAPCLEIGSYCGKSAIFLGEGCRTAGKHPLFSLDHHGGSEEQQPGQPYFDPDLYDPELQAFTTLQEFMNNLRRCALLDWVVPIAAKSILAGRYWHTPLSLVFIDGGHSEQDVFQDFHTWAVHLIRGGYLCVHDVFPDPADGGQAPYHMFEHARALRAWEYVGMFHSLGVLRKR